MPLRHPHRLLLHGARIGVDVEGGGHGMLSWRGGGLISLHASRQAVVIVGGNCLCQCD